jgi:hypothetical protein
MVTTVTSITAFKTLSLREPLKAYRQGVEPEQFLASLELLHIPDLTENQELLSKADPKLLQVARQLSELMLEKDLLRQSVETEALLDDRLVKALP